MKMSSTEETLAIINTFNELFNRHDVEGIIALITDDILFDNTFPAPDGQRVEGKEANRFFWQDFFENSPTSHFEQEEIFASENRAVVRWIYNWVNDHGQRGHVRGVDIFRVRDGKIAEKLSYVKG